MPFGAVKLVPGINFERTPTANEAGYSQSQLVRFRDGLAQKYGGWDLFYPLSLAGVPRALHAWQDLNQVKRLAVGTTAQLGVINGAQLRDITPQTKTTNFTPDFTTALGSPVVEIDDPNITTVTSFDSVFFNTPISVGGIILSGLYPIETVTGANSYTIRATMNATAAVVSGGAVPVFTTVVDSANVAVKLDDHGLSVVAPENTIVFPIPTTGNGVTIGGLYNVNNVTGVDDFVIPSNTQATASGSFSMNGGLAQLVYYIALGPPPAGVGYGIGGYGLGGYGTGVAQSVQTGDPIAAADWTLDNWGQILLACPRDGGIYFWDPTGGFQNMSLISSGPVFNRGMFVSTSAQILVAYGSTITEQIGVLQDPMLVQWSDSGNFFDWTPTETNLARNFRIPIGSRIITGLAVSNQNLIWTDLDLWVMNFVGFPNVYGFNKIGAGAGAASLHAVLQLRGGVYWMGRSNIYRYAGGVEVVKCPVWDAIFQNLNVDFLENVRAMPNTGFNEAGWLYPSLASVNGENDSYVKFNISEPGEPWDYGLLPRSAWIDQNVFGPPISAISGGIIYNQETGNDAAGQPMEWSFTTGYFKIAEGEDFAVIDQIIPDFKFGEFGKPANAQVTIVVNSVDYPGDTPRTDTFIFTDATQFLSCRIRGGLVSFTVSGNDLGSFVRLGYVRYRYSAQGRR